MPLNYPGPFELRLKYTTNEDVKINEHELRLSFQVSGGVLPGAAFNTIFPTQKDGGTLVNLANHLNSLMAVVDDHFNNTTDFTAAEVWEYAPGTFDSVFRTAQSVALPGTSGTGTAAFSQSIMTFRTIGGGIMKVDLRGTIHLPGARQSFPNAGIIQALANYIVGNTSIWWGRDNSYALAPLRWLPGSNEHAFKEVNR
ncbi:MAG TPA: hypothetical protein VFM05_15585 [Candidatus Saccharimonadales bacterium]|nr:hypothetical protein [Candidatus Saccharimonadales bacterium]